MMNNIPVWNCTCDINKPCHSRYRNGEFGYLYNSTYGGFDYSTKMYDLIDYFVNTYSNLNHHQFGHRSELADIYAYCMASAEDRKSDHCILKIKWFNTEYLHCVSHETYDGKETPFIDYKKYCLLKLLSLRNETNLNHIHREIDKIKDISIEHHILD